MYKKDQLTAPRQPAGHDAVGEEQLAQSRVLVVGAGGLGAPAAAYLAAAGVGAIGIIDPDRVELSNLHRQLLHRTSDLGRPKVASAQDRLQALAPHLVIEALQDRFDTHNAAQLVERYDFVIDGSDNFATKFLVNDVAVAHGTPFSHGGVVGFFGQTLTVVPGQTACYRCLFMAPPPADEVPTCQEAGILGPVAGVIGTMQAVHAVAFLRGDDGWVRHGLLTYDALQARWRTVKIRPNPRCPACSALRAPGSVERECSNELR